MASIELSHVVKRYGALDVVRDVSLEIADGERMILFGPSGCGKSTILRMIAGLEQITSGEVRIDGRRANEISPRERNLAMVFQSYALYPHLSVFENMAFPLRLARRRSGEEIRRKVEETARLLDLTELLGRKPGQLSGGQRQRVAMGRAIVREPKAFLFDEPLSNLDARLRGQMRTEIARLQRRLRVTTVYVTHDQTEAMTLGDRAAVLRKGVVQQVGSPRELFERPANLFVAGFIGSPPMNLVPARVHGLMLTLPFATAEIPEPLARQVSGRHSIVAGIRPESIEDAALVGEEARRRGVMFEAAIDVTEWLGSGQLGYVSYASSGVESLALGELARELGSASPRVQLAVSLGAKSSVRPGQQARLWLDPRSIHLFDAASGKSLAPEPP